MEKVGRTVDTAFTHTPSVPLSLSLGKWDCEGGTVFQRQTQWDGGSTLFHSACIHTYVLKSTGHI